MTPLATEPPQRSGPSLKGRALRLLALREHTRTELEKKLARHDPDPEELRLALDDLQTKGFISEERVVESVLHSRARRLGTRRIRQELQAKGVSAAAMTEAIQRLQTTEIERAREVWRKKFGALANEPKERARQARFLLARGFDAEVVRRVTQGDNDCS
ncbi:MAG: recombination regulator RecX [Alphaproteobacteria bacterium]|nr:recombination regulator RecX [Alphaproteobacteria bacterium]